MWFEIPRDWIFFSIQTLHRVLSFRSHILNFRRQYLMWVLWFFVSACSLCLKYTCLSNSLIGFLNLYILKVSTFPWSLDQILDLDYEFDQNEWQVVKLRRKCSHLRTEENHSKWYRELPRLCFSMCLIIFSLLFWVATLGTLQFLNRHRRWERHYVLSSWWFCQICSAGFALVWSVGSQKATLPPPWLFRLISTKQCWCPSSPFMVFFCLGVFAAPTDLRLAPTWHDCL